MQRIKVALMMLVMSSVAGIRADWKDVDGLFRRLDEVQEEWINADKKFRDEYSGRMSSLNELLQQNNSSRVRVYECIQSSLNAMSSCLSNCLANKDRVKADYDARILDLNNQIDEYRRTSEQTINGLKRDVESRESDVERTQESINTINALTEENLAKALEQIKNLQEDYRATGEEFDKFIDQLNNFLDNALVYAYNRKNESQNLIDNVCVG